MNILNMVLGLIYMVLATIGIIVVIFMPSPVVPTFALWLGFFVFMVIGSFGMKKLLEAMLARTVDFQVNN